MGDAGGAEGVLTRKHDWESATKKASTRSWDKVILSTKFRLVQKLNSICVRIVPTGLCCSKKQSFDILQGPKSIEGLAREYVPW